MTELKKHYYEGMIILPEGDPTFANILTEYESLMSMAELFGATEDFKVAYKEFAGRVRALLNLTNMVSFHRMVGDDGSKGLGVALYPVPYLASLQVAVGQDDEGFFIEMKEVAFDE